MGAVLWSALSEGGSMRPSASFHSGVLSRKGNRSGVYSQCPEFKNLCVVYDIAGCFFRHTLTIEPNLESNLWLNKIPLLKDSLHFFSDMNLLAKLPGEFF